MKLLRTKSVLATIAIVLVVTSFFIFYVDNVVKSLTISSLQAMTGAKVEIDSSCLSFSPIGFRFKGIQLANKEKPMENKLEIAELSAQVLLAPALRKRLVISEILVTGIAMDTPRKTSGALPKSPPPPPKKDPLIDWSKLDPDKFVNTLSLKSVTGIDTFAYTKQANVLEDRFKRTSDSFTLTITTAKEASLLEDLGVVAAKYETLSKVETWAPEDLLTVKDGIDALGDFREKIVTQKQMLQKSYADYLATIAEIDKAKDNLPKLLDQDLDRALKALDLSQYTADGVSDMVFKDSVLAQINQAKHIFDIVGKLNGADEHKVKRVRGKGTTILFPLKQEYPSVWIQRIAVSETHVSGTLLNYSTNQPLTGSPLTAAVRFPINKVPIQVFFTADYRTPEHPIEELRIQSQPITLTTEQVKNLTRGLLDTSEGRLLLSGTFTRENNYFSGNIEGKLIPLPTALPSKSWLSKSLSKMKTIELSADLTEKYRKTTFSLDTNIDEHLAEELKNLQTEVLGKAKIRLNQELNAQVTQRQAQLEKAIAPIKEDVDAYQKQLLALSQATDRLNTLSDELTKRVDQQNALLKQKAEQKAEAVQSKVKAEAASQLKARLKF